MTDATTASSLPRLGLFLAYWPWVTHDEQLELARIADGGGLDALWVAEAWGQEAVAWLAAQPERIGLGSAIMQIPARKPATTAAAAPRCRCSAAAASGSASA